MIKRKQNTKIINDLKETEQTINDQKETEQTDYQ